MRWNFFWYFKALSVTYSTFYFIIQFYGIHIHPYESHSDSSFVSIWCRYWRKNEGIFQTASDSWIWDGCSDDSIASWKLEENNLRPTFSPNARILIKSVTNCLNCGLGENDFGTDTDELDLPSLAREFLVGSMKCCVTLAVFRGLIWKFMVWASSVCVINSWLLIKLKTGGQRKSGGSIWPLPPTSPLDGCSTK